MPITKSAIEKARIAVKNAPPMKPREPTFTKTRAISMLAAELEDLLGEKNYTADQAAELLKKEGICIAPSTLKAALYSAKNKRTSQPMRPGQP